MKNTAMMFTAALLLSEGASRIQGAHLRGANDVGVVTTNEVVVDAAGSSFSNDGAFRLAATKTHHVRRGAELSKSSSVSSPIAASSGEILRKDQTKGANKLTASGDPVEAAPVGDNASSLPASDLPKLDEREKVTTDSRLQHVEHVEVGVSLDSGGTKNVVEFVVHPKERSNSWLSFGGIEDHARGLPTWSRGRNSSSGAYRCRPGPHPAHQFRFFDGVDPRMRWLASNRSPLDMPRSRQYQYYR